MPMEKCTVKYRDIDHTLHNCWKLLSHENCQGDLSFGKTDLKSAFRMAGIKVKHWYLLIMKAEHLETSKVKYPIDKCMPFRASISCSHFQRISNALKHIVEVLENHFNSITNYLDNFLFIPFLRQICNRLMRRFLSVCEEICFPVALEKSEWATSCIIFLGIMLNSRKLVLMIPEDKVYKAIQLIDRLCDRKKATVKEVQSLTGTLNFLC